MHRGVCGHLCLSVGELNQLRTFFPSFLDLNTLNKGVDSFAPRLRNWPHMQGFPVLVTRACPPPSPLLSVRLGARGKKESEFPYPT